MLLSHPLSQYGRMLQADPRLVSRRAKKRGLPQLGTLGAGNHYCEIQVVDEIHDRWKAGRMGLQRGQVVVMIHSGSRGLGHQVATDALVEMERAMSRDGIVVNDRQLACAKINSVEGQVGWSERASEGRLERIGSKSILSPSSIINNLPLVASLLASPLIPTLFLRFASLIAELPSLHVRRRQLRLG